MGARSVRCAPTRRPRLLTYSTTRNRYTDLQEWSEERRIELSSRATMLHRMSNLRKDHDIPHHQIPKPKRYSRPQSARLCFSKVDLPPAPHDVPELRQIHQRGDMVPRDILRPESCVFVSRYSGASLEVSSTSGIFPVHCSVKTVRRIET